MIRGHRLLAILGSPHAGGRCASMLNCAAEAARAAGWQVDVISLYEKKLGFCTGCRACMKLGHCVRRDDIGEIEELIKTCDVVALAAPVYWANVPAAVKNMFDRLYGTAMEETGAFPKARLSHNQKFLLLTACNTPFPFSFLCGQSRGGLRAMEEFFKTSGMRCLGRLAWTGAPKPDRQNCPAGSNSPDRPKNPASSALPGYPCPVPARIRRKIQTYWS